MVADQIGRDGKQKSPGIGDAVPIGQAQEAKIGLLCELGGGVSAADLRPAQVMPERCVLGVEEIAEVRFGGQVRGLRRRGKSLAQAPRRSPNERRAGPARRALRSTNQRANGLPLRGMDRASNMDQ